MHYNTYRIAHAVATPSISSSFLNLEGLSWKRLRKYRRRPTKLPGKNRQPGIKHTSSNKRDILSHYRSSAFAAKISFCAGENDKILKFSICKNLSKYTQNDKSGPALPVCVLGQRSKVDKSPDFRVHYLLSSHIKCTSSMMSYMCEQKTRLKSQEKKR